jgi:hypothetical protein
MSWNDNEENVEGECRCSEMNAIENGKREVIWWIASLQLPKRVRNCTFFHAKYYIHAYMLSWVTYHSYLWKL